MEAGTGRLQQRHHGSSAERLEGPTGSPGSMFFQEQTLCRGYKEGKNVGPVYAELFWNRSCTFNSYALTPEPPSCEAKPSEGQSHRFSFQNLTCLQAPSRHVCGFMMKVTFERDGADTKRNAEIRGKKIQCLSQISYCSTRRAGADWGILKEVRALS